VLVTDDDGLILGIFTERDVLRRLATLGAAGGDLPISEVMTARPKVLHADDSIVYALHEMHIGGYRHIPLTDGSGRPVKIASVRHMVDYLAERLGVRDAGEANS
jgi:CBS domain-containing protein